MKIENTSQLEKGYHFVNNPHVFKPNICIGSTNFLDIGKDIKYKTVVFKDIQYEFAGSTLCLDGYTFCLEYKPINNTSVQEESNRWWWNLTMRERWNLFFKYNPMIADAPSNIGLNLKNINVDHIEEIWLKENKPIKDVVICQNCKRFHYKGVTKCCYCDSTSLADTHPLNSKYVEQDYELVSIGEETIKLPIESYPKEFDIKEFKKYISALSNDDRINAISILSCEIHTLNPTLNELLNRISSYGKIGNES